MKEFNLNKWWKKVLAGLGIVGLFFLSVIFFFNALMGFVQLLSLIDPGASFIHILVSSAVVYYCYRGIRRLGRDWKKSGGKKR